MKNTTQSELKFKNSGLYEQPFYHKRYIYELDLSQVSWDRDIYFENNKDIEEDYIDERFYESLSYYNTYYKVNEFDYDENLAYECHLIPFILENDYHDEHMLALGGCGMDMSPKLDAYFFLSTGKLDKYSTYFRDKQFFKYMVSTDIFDKIESIYN